MRDRTALSLLAIVCGSVSALSRLNVLLCYPLIQYLLRGYRSYVGGIRDFLNRLRIIGNSFPELLTIHWNFGSVREDLRICRKLQYPRCANCPDIGGLECAGSHILNVDIGNPECAELPG